MMKMIGEQVKLTKRVHYFGMELDVPLDTVCITTNSDGGVTAWADGHGGVWRNGFSSKWVSDRGCEFTYICQVDLCGVDWQDTMMRVPL